jgi:hypothetical protein
MLDKLEQADVDGVFFLGDGGGRLLRHGRGRRGLAAARGENKDERKCKDRSNQLFHGDNSFFIQSFCIRSMAQRKLHHRLERKDIREILLFDFRK